MSDQTISPHDATELIELYSPHYRSLVRLAARQGARLPPADRGQQVTFRITVALSPAAAYAILDGLFQQALLRQLAGREAAASDLAANVVRVLDTLDSCG